MADKNKSATLTLEGKSFELPVLSPTAGPDVIDIRKLYTQAGVFTYDPPQNPKTPKGIIGGMGCRF